MILTFSELRSYRGAVSMVDGAFDPLHAGHIAYFRAAAALGRPLLCNIASDAYIRTKHPVLLPARQRAIVVDALRDIAFTHLNERETDTILEYVRPYAYIKGWDWKGRLPQSQIDICQRFGLQIVYLETPRESSTRLLEAARDEIRDRPTSDYQWASADHDL